MKKEEFAKRWDSNEEGGGITYDDVANCAKEWGLFERPRTVNMEIVIKKVIEESGAKDKWEGGK